MVGVSSRFFGGGAADAGAGAAPADAAACKRGRALERLRRLLSGGGARAAGEAQDVADLRGWLLGAAIGDAGGEEAEAAGAAAGGGGGAPEQPAGEAGDEGHDRRREGGAQGGGRPTRARAAQVREDARLAQLLDEQQVAFELHALNPQHQQQQQRERQKQQPRPAGQEAPRKRRRYRGATWGGGELAHQLRTGVYREAHLPLAPVQRQQADALEEVFPALRGASCEDAREQVVRFVARLAAREGARNQHRGIVAQAGQGAAPARGPKVEAWHSAAAGRAARKTDADVRAREAQKWHNHHGRFQSLLARTGRNPDGIMDPQEWQAFLKATKKYQVREMTRAARENADFRGTPRRRGVQALTEHPYHTRPR